TPQGTTLVKSLGTDVGSGPDYTLYTANVSGTLFFSFSTKSSYNSEYASVSGVELWKSDGTTAGTTIVKDIASGVWNSNPTDLVDVDGRLFFVADDRIHGRELWTSDGTEAGTILVADIYPGAGSASPTNLVGVNGRLLFSAADPLAGRELWRSDGT